ncbi:nidogen-1 [Asbolus verrucosus]|uniref:Nidogen-1 n=1 Tax=Asbolus verrucosus TaxID=1661398 RepID=A0A482V8X7_ASBVE|nr:nidogen-1 [Asbolus verrucosus]
MKLLRNFCCCIFLVTNACGIPVSLLYEHNVDEVIKLPKENDVSSPEIKLKVPVVFYGTRFNSIFVNSNGLISFQTEIPNFFNIEFPLDYPLIAPFYTNVDTRQAGTVSYYETNNSSLLRRATDNVRDYFSEQENFQATSLFIVTWSGVGYFNKGSDKINTYQTVIVNDGTKSFVEFLYPKDGIQWIQGTGDESGLPDARAQAGFISVDGKIFTLPGSGTEQVRNLEVWSNIDLPGQFVYRVDESDIVSPDLVNDESKLNGPPLSCADAPTYCHVQAKCVDYTEGFCCQCKKQYYGNGKFCIKKDVPLRVNGKVSGNINGERLDNLDLQSYIVMVDGRAYTAISKIPESIGFDIQSLQILGGVIGYVFAKPIRNALNAYQITGGVFNHTATLRFLNTSETIIIKQKYIGLDVFDQLRLETNIQGEIPNLPFDSKITVDEYQEQYTQTAPVTCDVLNNCNRNAQCLYSPESETFSCKCNAGFEGDGYNCEMSTLSCTQLHNCHVHASCTYDESVGKSKCVCNPGYEGDGFNCKITGHFQQSVPPTVTAQKQKNVSTQVRKDTNVYVKRVTFGTLRINVLNPARAVAAAVLPPLQIPLGGSGIKLYGLVAVPQSCPTITNVCQYYKDQCPADHICLPNGGGSRTCVCTFNADDPSEIPSCTL